MSISVQLADQPYICLIKKFNPSFNHKLLKQAEAEVVPSSSLVEDEVEVEI